MLQKSYRTSKKHNRLFTLTGPALISTIPWYMVWWRLKHLKKTKVVVDEAAMVVQHPTSLLTYHSPRLRRVYEIWQLNTIARGARELTSESIWRNCVMATCSVRTDLS